MEIAFYSNKCALKDTIRLIRHAKNPCLKRRKQLLSYSNGLISTNKSIISLHQNISPEEQKEFLRLIDQIAALSSSFAQRENEKCPVCLINCIPPSKELSSAEEERELEKISNINLIECPFPENKTEKIADVAEKMERLNNKAQLVESIVSLQGDTLNRSVYDTHFSIEYSQSHLQELEDIIRRKKRNMLLKKWFGAVFVFLCFLSLLFMRPFIR